MSFQLFYTQQSRKDLAGFDKKQVIQILNKLEFFINQRSPLKYAKPLTGPLKGLFRFRIGDFRAIFHKNTNNKITILTILTIKQRKDLY
ncbi:hypothetical protein A2533_04810 [Candidatus Falkowbacteria bacterium RIFOXYD2_FULL_35_9]|uniref:Addiction module toxin RelE n=1 Tax=Candidatus Falkowbacteria bacterium RIFOXYC2_FULL_36_12 TaxID=1798002 RepID=A0A1F5SYA1_9BACT|nr:MAG: hypothetical protein A2478_04375 [Candidatus Falkowbacteria bacterium RIFOXYC2_FULL_36_12]OGF33179.1 MAG: hypothetical protein A2223_04920 [Candidatus Falkowbacteria bacterium RIFOXYA2_FULL_35_8]OGF46175.1 MAG: hypothetical protein A2533_04810 [Candidatus Falkowbacteria bacterium RIFOXYD2_FULL_35_9]